MPDYTAGGATAKEIWEYTTRTLTEYYHTVSVIKNKNYDEARPEDFLYANLVRIMGEVTTDELAGFVDYGVTNLANQDAWASILEGNPFGLWPGGDVADIFNSASITASNIKAILASARISGDRVQEILYAMADKLYVDRLLEIITLDATDEAISADTTNTEGVMYRKTLSIAAGVTLTIGAGPGVVIADTVDNSGTIASGWTVGTGGAPGTPPGAGGGGVGAVIILARTANIGTVTATGGAGEAGSTTAASANGSDGGGGNFWVVDPDTVPSGGDGGAYDVAGAGAGNPNGGGGGGHSSAYLGGDGGSATVTNFSDGSSLASELLKCAADWWIQNVLGKTLTSAKSFPNLGGSGGGGGVDVDGYNDAGGGGGGGGEVIIVANGVTAGTVDVSGGAGGNGGAEGGYDSAGGGGGGGIAYVLYKSLTGTMTFTAAGGAGGTGDYIGAAGGDGVGRAIAI